MKAFIFCVFMNIASAAYQTSCQSSADCDGSRRCWKMEMDNSECFPEIACGK